MVQTTGYEHQMRRAPEGATEWGRAISAAPAGARIQYSRRTGGLHHRLISTTPPAPLINAVPSFKRFSDQRQFFVRVIIFDARAEAALTDGMKTFAAMLFAILIALGVFYLIHQQKETAADRAALSAEMHQTPSSLPGYGVPPQDAPQPAASPVPIESSVTPVAALEIKLQTIDGPVIIPKGTVLRILSEKSKPGTIVINYEGYTLTIPTSAITSAPE